MKIVDVCEFYSPRGGGVRSYVDQKLAAAAISDSSLVVIAPGPRDATEERPGGRIHWVRSPHERFDKRYHRFTDAAPIHALLDQEQPDVIEISSPWQGAKMALGYETSVPRSFIFHMDPVAVYPETFLLPYLKPATIDWLATPLWAHLRRINARCDTTIVASRTVTARLAAHGFKRLATVPLGIDLPLFANSQAAPEMRQSLLRSCGFDDPATPLLIALSRHHPEKRLGLLMRAVTKVNQHKPLGLVVVGAGPWERQVRSVARRSTGIYVAGAVQDRAMLATMVASSDALLHGGAAETYGIAVAEALAAGLPVIVPDRGGAADFAQGPQALSYPAGDVAACVVAILTLLSSPDLRFRQAAARAAASQLLTPQMHLRALMRHYERLPSFIPPLSKKHNLATLPPRC